MRHWNTASVPLWLLIGSRFLIIKGKPTRKPTARWVFELFLDVHLLWIGHDPQGNRI